MSNGKRKLSFLGFGAPGPGGAEGDEELCLDSEMDRVVWAANQTERSRDIPSPDLDRQARLDQRLMPDREDGRHVQFTGSPPLTHDVAEFLDEEQKERHLHHPKGRKFSLQEGGRPALRERRVSVTPSEEPLPENDSEQGNETVYINRKDGGDKVHKILLEPTYKKMYDHSPHSVFVQLDELLAGQWQETARWIKYEEDIEEGSERWGKPHVASLSFHSLLNLRRCIENGVLLLDLEERDLPGVAYRLVEKMVEERLIEEDDGPIVMRSLLLRHKHVHDERGFRFSIGGRKHSSYTSLQSLWAEEGDSAALGAGRTRCSMCSPGAHCRRHSSMTTSLFDGKRRRSSYAVPPEKGAATEKKTSLPGLEQVEFTIPVGSQEDIRRTHNDTILKRIPIDAQATTVLVGAVDFLEQPTIAFVRLAEGIILPSVTEVPIPVRFMFVLLGPRNADLDYHEIGRSIATLMSNRSFLSTAYKADDRRDLLSAINEFLDDSIVLPPGNWDRQALIPFEEIRAKSQMIRRRKLDALQKKIANGAPEQDIEKKALLIDETGGLPPDEPLDPLDRSGKLFGGVIRDMQRRYPYYLSDIKDGIGFASLGAIIFMYFAALSSAITFGGLLAEKTNNAIGISETLVLTCVGGVIFALASGQPLMITGTTGPLLLLDQSMALFCKDYGYDFLVARMYCGLWMIAIASVVACFEGSVAVKHITRFTEDIFAFLICIIFISEPVTSLINLFKAHPLGVDYCEFNSTNTTGFNTTEELPQEMVPQPNTALFCMMLTLTTFIIAYYLRIFRNGKFLGRNARRALGDYGVPIAIGVMATVSYFVPVWKETLSVPEGLSPTSPRPWFVLLSPAVKTFPISATFLTFLPAGMVYIIVFMETHIAELIVAKPERKLKKGSGFHMDIVIITLINCLCGFTGAPWQCVATVRSVSHVAALTTMSKTHAPGDKPHIVEVKEQRVTGLMVSILVGLSVLGSEVLKLVPISVLFGVFLYMGISALSGIQFWERFILLFKPVKHHPQVPYVRRVPTWKMNVYTIIQFLGLCLLYGIKMTKVSLSLPFFLVSMIFLRKLLVYFYTPLELRALDGAQSEIDKDDEPDFYEEAPLP